MRKPVRIINVGKIVIEGRFTHCENEDHTQVVIVDDGMEFVKFNLSVPGLKALYAELADHLRAFEDVRNRR